MVIPTASRNIIAPTDNIIRKHSVVNNIIDNTIPNNCLFVSPMSLIQIKFIHS